MHCVSSSRGAADVDAAQRADAPRVEIDPLVARFDGPPASLAQGGRGAAEASPAATDELAHRTVAGPHCQNEMRIVALIDQADVIERILRHLGLWDAGVRVESARDPPEPDEPIIEPWLGDPFPNYDHEPVFAQN